ncbi:MAG: 50S ribosomal protein L31 [Elusimicrobiales bacterium]|nr:50S ribosomal protein L31 [Elusimicrobiales bacterium]
MKAKIHPKYQMCEVSCACGNTFQTRSMGKVIKLEICSACHPFYTGKQKLLDVAGRVERFKKRFSKTEGKMIKRKPKKIAASKTAPKHIKKKVLTSASKKVEKEAPKAKSKK